IESAVALGDRDALQPEDLPERITRPQAPAAAEDHAGEDSLKGKVEQFEKELIAKTMAEVGGNKNLVAKILKMTRRNLDYKIKRYGL
ncbi:MAG: helix-turn-helix domain-containing protein, partial [Candidatus Omnitrophica bacterium]|nr:helix-turn-helix domain-containing protein [Candidatus Omnitrophota bacterium]